MGPDLSLAGSLFGETEAAPEAPQWELTANHTAGHGQARQFSKQHLHAATALKLFHSKITNSKNNSGDIVSQVPKKGKVLNSV